jgi:predicted amidohydrolase YtcJ
MGAADLVVTGSVLTVDDARPTAEAIAVADGRIVAVGDRSDMAAFSSRPSARRPSTPLAALLRRRRRLARVGKHADAVVPSAVPRTVTPEQIADLGVRATLLAGRQVYGAVTPGDT